MSLSFIRGLVAAVNPCGFILLPTYLMYFLGITAGAGGSQRASIRRALLVSAAVSAGFLSVFLVAGLISYNFTSWVNENSKYATVGIGSALIVLGVAMLLGYKLPFMTPQVGIGKKEKTVRAMFVYGIAYAVASIGCTIGLFIATVFSTTRRDGLIHGVGNTVAYGAGMALLVSALTVSLAFANTTLLRWLRKSLAHVDKVAAAFVLLSGFYLIWYFYWVDLLEEGDPITDWAFERQARATQFLDDNWKPVAIVLGTIVVVAIGYVWFRGGDADVDPLAGETDPPVDSTPADATSADSTFADATPNGEPETTDAIATPDVVTSDRATESAFAVADSTIGDEVGSTNAVADA
ncbi:MAG: cytochrome c biogenesis protein CcdA [Acidimicrobiia bacterium]|nr:cytochrome c biogenesis protein CcdA [Acidimicrobiia bacterium]